MLTAGFEGSSLNSPGPHASLGDWLDWQERLHARGIDLGLDRVRPVAQRLGLVPSSIPTLIVGGTNGKGSSATLASLVLRESGHSTGLYTSPHLLRYNERIAVDGVEARDEECVAAFVAIEAARQDIPLTYFEFGTLAALWLFRARGVAAQVLEVGLGGRLDAVNLVDADAALVTSIGLDHTDWLGPDRESIALEKAHVFRAGRVAVCAEPDAPRAIAGHAAAIGARLRQAGRDFVFTTRDGAWDWWGSGASYTGLPMPGLAGDEQLRNASGVIAALEGLRERLAIPEEAVRRALPRLALRGRFERIGDTIFDVAHNAEAAAALCAKLARVVGARRVPIVMGMLSDKPVEAVCRALGPVAGTVHAIGLPPPRGLAAADLLARASSAGLTGVAHAGVGEALAAARAEAGPGQLVLVTGSFLTVAAGLANE